VHRARILMALTAALGLALTTAALGVGLMTYSASAVATPKGEGVPFTFRPYAEPGLCLEATARLDGSPPALGVRQCAGDENQKWIFQRVQPLCGVGSGGDCWNDTAEVYITVGGRRWCLAPNGPSLEPPPDGTNCRFLASLQLHDGGYVSLSGLSLGSDGSTVTTDGDSTQTGNHQLWWRVAPTASAIDHAWDAPAPGPASRLAHIHPAGNYGSCLAGVRRRPGRVRIDRGCAFSTEVWTVRTENPYQSVVNVSLSVTIDGSLQCLEIDPDAPIHLVGADTSQECPVYRAVYLPGGTGIWLRPPTGSPLGTLNYKLGWASGGNLTEVRGDERVDANAIWTIEPVN